ncbi:uncharacterized protein LOC127082695 [Lathyrus oleraceus]|uniref:uncharacterized protein LOC127082695 n=1 Tax=Pisum sativum TaxID=3888 RepID=UPI0021D1B740|nr:uncharacterized protein LOC127082695 [Pisum sativum]
MSPEDEDRKFELRATLGRPLRNYWTVAILQCCIDSIVDPRRDGESRTTPRNGVAAGNGEGGVIPKGEECVGCCFGFSYGPKGGRNQQGVSPPPPPLAGNVEAPINGNGEDVAVGNGEGNGEGVAVGNGEGNGEGVIAGNSEGVAAGNGEGVATRNGEGNDEGVAAGNGEGVADPEGEYCVGCCFGFSCGPKGGGNQQGVSPPHPPPPVSI